jgi:hypothetical protein
MMRLDMASPKPVPPFSRMMALSTLLKLLMGLAALALIIGPSWIGDAILHAEVAKPVPAFCLVEFCL